MYIQAFGPQALLFSLSLSVFTVYRAALSPVLSLLAWCLDRALILASLADHAKAAKTS